MDIKNNRNGYYGLTPNGIHFAIKHVMDSLYEKGVLHRGGISCNYRVMVNNNNVKLIDPDFSEYDKSHEKEIKEAEYISEWLPTDRAVFEAYTKSF